MIQSFRDQATEDIYNGQDTKKARRVCPIHLWGIARRKLEMLAAVNRLEALRVPPNNRLERLKEDRAGQHSIRINDQYRVCFTWTEAGAENVEITDYH